MELREELRLIRKKQRKLEDDLKKFVESDTFRELKVTEYEKYSYLALNPNLTYDIVRKKRDCVWDRATLSMNQCITQDILRDHSFNWNMYFWKLNPNYLNYVVDNLKDFRSDSHDHAFFMKLSQHHRVTWEIVQSRPDLQWSYSGLAKNPNITWEIVQAHPEKPWDYAALSANINITWEIVRENLNASWDWSVLSSNPNITWEIVRSNPLFNWIYCWLSENENITWKIMQDNPEYDWNLQWFSCNPNVTWDIVLKNPEKHWNYHQLLSNDFGRSQLERREHQILKKLGERQCKNFYYQMIHRMSQPPNGYYFRKDLADLLALNAQFVRN